ncbi:MAG: agmatine deiminase family protein [Candidatus Cloacimonetes bacterium]|nr:agmatine deiminase family protein [Candidatus Cloacimonadota bacterium]
MKLKIRIILLVFISFAFSLNSIDNMTTLENPIMAHFLSFEEMLLNEDYERDFTPTEPPVGDIRQTSEFEQMEGVLVVYPLGLPVEFVAEMSQDILVYTIVESFQQSQCENSYQNNGVNMENCVFINAPTNTYWVRDYGPWFISVDNEIQVVDFPYNRPRPNDDDIPIVIANYFDLDVYGMDLEGAGGNYMCDGNFVAASTDLIYDENPNLNAAEIDQMVLDYLGIDSYHVTLDPLDDYIKHIDCWGKFLDVDKILIGQVPETDYRYEDFEFVANYFSTQTSAWGTNYEVFRIYSPGGYNQPTPYTNSLILNNKVFVPQSGSQWDDEAIATYEEIMPGYEVIGVYYNGWYDTDALHCRTRGIADRNMLYIQHDPIIEEVPAGVEIEILAQIIPYSSETLYADSLLVNYKVNDSNYNSIIMIPTGENNYLAMIPAQEPGSELSYYIHAADESGHSSNHPLIGAPDPHLFIIEGNPNPAELVVDPVSFNVEMLANQQDLEILELSNIGGMALTYNITDSADWLTLSPETGELSAGETEEIELTFDTTDLSTGEYTTDITINDDREETIIPVILTITQTESENETVISGTKLLGNYPNPFNPTTTISYSLKSTSSVNLAIYNMKGQLVRILVNSSQIAGMHTKFWDGKDDNGRLVGSGVYFSRLEAYDVEGTHKSLKKIILLK